MWSNEFLHQIAPTTMLEHTNHFGERLLYMADIMGRTDRLYIGLKSMLISTFPWAYSIEVGEAECHVHPGVFPFLPHVWIE